MENLGMLPGSLDAGSHALLTSPPATHAVRTVRSTNIIAALFTAACRVPRIVSMWHERIASRHALVNLNDHVLRDIGLSRADVEREFMKPFWQE
jgi:uncharacterized protein YjiS (DUF1127 family)